MNFCKTSIILSFAAMSASMMTAEPVVSNVTLAQDQSTRKVTITYSLSQEPGIVTVDILTNGVSIGDANLTHFAGDVNRVVQTGNARTIHWYPEEAWPSNRTDAATALVTAWATNAPPNYMVVDLIDGAMTYYTSTNCLPDGGLANDVYRTDRMVFRKIPARGVTWRMGSPTNELGRTKTGGTSDETPHLVTLTKDYWFGIYPVTMGQHKRFTDNNTDYAPSSCFFTNIASHLTRPMQGIGMKSVRSSNTVSWPDSGHAVASGTYIAKFRAKAGGLPFDLPTEAQWEYAARAGAGTALTTGKDLNQKDADPQLDVLGRYQKNCGLADTASEDAAIRANDDSTGTSKVGIYLPNNWGIYDIHGNVHDLCLDRYAAYEGDMESVQTDPVGGDSSINGYVARGGCWGYYDGKRGGNAANCRLATRRWADNDADAVVSRRHVGYRLCLEIE
jgi:formylglycine-generating enzyme required for sulfatase activity